MLLLPSIGSRENLEELHLDDTEKLFILREESNYETGYCQPCTRVASNKTNRQQTPSTQSLRRRLNRERVVLAYLGSRSVRCKKGSVMAPKNGRRSDDVPASGILFSIHLIPTVNSLF